MMCNIIVCKIIQLNDSINEMSTWKIQLFKLVVNELFIITCLYDQTKKKNRDLL